MINIDWGSVPLNDKISIGRHMNREREIERFENRFSWKWRLKIWEQRRQKRLAELRKLNVNFSKSDLVLEDDLPF